MYKKFKNGDIIILDDGFGRYCSIITDIHEKNNTCTLHDFHSYEPNIGCILNYVCSNSKVATRAEVIIYG